MGYEEMHQSTLVMRVWHRLGCVPCVANLTMIHGRDLTVHSVQVTLQVMPVTFKGMG